MKTAIRASGLCLVVLVASSFLVAQDAKKGDAKKPAHRLPSNYAKLDLSDEQKTKIYAVQDSYASKIDALEEQLAALKAKQKTEIEAILKPEQVKKLSELKAEADGAKKAKGEQAKKEKQAAKSAPASDAKKPAEKK